MKKILKWLKKIAIAGISVLVLVKFISAFIFLVYVDSGFEKYYWKGNWKSNQHKFKSGTIISNIPYYPPIDEPMAAEMIIFNDFLTFKNPFQHSTFKYHGIISPQLTQSEAYLLGDSLSIAFWGKATGSNGNKYEFIGSLNGARNSVSGSYRCTMPPDIGVFTLTRK